MINLVIIIFSTKKCKFNKWNWAPVVYIYDQFTKLKFCTSQNYKCATPNFNSVYGTYSPQINGLIDSLVTESAGSTLQTPSMDSILIQLNPIQNLTTYFYKIHFNIIFPSYSQCSKSSPSKMFTSKTVHMLLNFWVWAIHRLVKNCCSSESYLWLTVNLSRY